MAALLALVTIAVYWPARQYDFVNYDDDLYVTSNVHVQNGLTWENLSWAFVNPVAANWHPLTMLSHMLDCQMFGLHPRGHHLTSVLLHAVNSVLVFLLLRSLTGAIWRSLLVAAVFGLHPLQVESVAWVAERKNVLSVFWGLLALIFYARYARKRSTVERRENQAGEVAAAGPRTPVLDYLLALFCFSLGLMSKPMLVTWPFVMLLLDYWPLERFKPGSARRLVAEKIPFFALAVGAGIATYMVQQHEGAVWVGDNLPLGARSGNALISYCRYLGNMVWPTDLAVFYPYPGDWPLKQVLLAGGVMAGISALLFVKRRQYPFSLMGWLWFCGTFVPVIGLVQVGAQSMADRYVYVPSLGVLISAVWGVFELTRRWRHQMIVLSVAGSAVIILCIGLTRQQLGYWKDSEALFRHALEVTQNNYLAHNNLGAAFFKKGQSDEAIRQFQEAIRLKPDFANAHYNLGLALDEKGQTDQAINQYQETLRLTPDYAEAHNNLGTALGRKGQLDEAFGEFQEVIRLKPDYAEAHNNLGNILLIKGRVDEAMSQHREAIRLKPDYAEAHYNLGNDLFKKGQIDEAINQYQEAIRLKPDFAEAHYNLTRALGMENAPANR